MALAQSTPGDSPRFLQSFARRRFYAEIAAAIALVAQQGAGHSSTRQGEPASQSSQKGGNHE